MSNINKWNIWYKDLKNIEPYGDTESYKIGSDFLFDCEQVEDWGCGKGWFRLFLDRNSKYIGLDGTFNKFVDKHVDLETYTSNVDGIFMRHVLEHNYNWKIVLQNALKSFKKKMVLIIFTPWSEDKTKQIGFTDSVGVPDISFLKDDIINMLDDYEYRELELQSKETFYGIEYVFLISK